MHFKHKQDMPTQKQDVILITNKVVLMVVPESASTRPQRYQQHILEHVQSLPPYETQPLRYDHHMIAFATAQAPFFIRNMLFDSKSPLAFNVHSVSKSIMLMLSMPCQGVSTISFLE